MKTKHFLTVHVLISITILAPLYFYSGSAHTNHIDHTHTSYPAHAHTLHHGQPTSPWSSNITSPQTEMNPFILSPSTSCHSPGPDLTRDELKAILELSDNVI